MFIRRAALTNVLLQLFLQPINTQLFLFPFEENRLIMVCESEKKIEI